MKRTHDFDARERKHGDRITVDTYPNGALLIQVGLQMADEDEVSWNAIRLEPRVAARLRKLLGVNR